MSATIIVLADGETWTMAHNCEILVISDGELEELMAGDISCGDLDAIAELELKDRTPGNTLY